MNPLDLPVPLSVYLIVSALLFVLLCWYLRMSKLCVADMFTDSNGKLSQAKMWTNIAYATATAIVWKQGTEGKLSPEMLLIYLAIIGGAEVAKKWLEVKRDIGATPKE